MCWFGSFLLPSLRLGRQWLRDFFLGLLVFSCFGHRARDWSFTSIILFCRRSSMLPRLSSCLPAWFDWPPRPARPSLFFSFSLASRSLFLLFSSLLSARLGGGDFSGCNTEWFFPLIPTQLTLPDTARRAGWLGVPYASHKIIRPSSSRINYSPLRFPLRAGAPHLPTQTLDARTHTAPTHRYKQGSRLFMRRLPHMPRCG